MTSLFWVMESSLLGVLIVARWTGIASASPAWVRGLLIFGAGTAGGFGLSSILFFLFGVLLGSSAAAMTVELGILVWSGYEVWRRRLHLVKSNGKSPSPVPLILLGAALLLALGIATAAMTSAWTANPQGNWDAWAIWNLRAKILASGPGLAARAWSPVIGDTTHPEYPLLLSSFIARCWAFSGSASAAAPVATSYAFFLALMALVWGGVTRLRGPTLGGLAALVLAATPSLLHEVPAQYADVPLACYFAGAIVFTLLDWPVLGGIFAGLAAWTKDEGSVFLLLFLAAVLVLRRKVWVKTLIGAAPAVLVVLVFKGWLARGISSQLSLSVHGAASRLGDPSRYWTVMSAFGREFSQLGAGWYHPLLPLVVLALVLRFDRSQYREIAFAGTILASLLAAYFGIYVLTPRDLPWQLQTSLGRLLVQAWPLVVLTCFVILRKPEEKAFAQAALPSQARRKVKRQKAAALRAGSLGQRRSG